MADPTLIGIAVVEHEGLYLVGQRPDDTDLPGLAEFPGGKVEAGEDPCQTALRECLEETGLEVDVVGQFPTCLHLYEHGLLELYFFQCRPRQPLKDPLPPFRWLPREQLQQLNFPAANRELLDWIQSNPSSSSHTPPDTPAS